MKKLFLALFLMAFISVSFSAPALKSVEEDVKKEFCKISKVESTVSVNSDVVFETRVFDCPEFTMFSDTRLSVLKSHTFEKSLLNTNPYNYDISQNRFSITRNINNKKPDISG